MQTSIKPIKLVYEKNKHKSYTLSIEVEIYGMKHFEYAPIKGVKYKRKNRNLVLSYETLENRLEKDAKNIIEHARAVFINCT
jgi:hypothetical protein